MEIIIRKEEEKDFDIVEKIVEEAFKNAEFSDHSEHKLVSRLRKSNEFIEELSLVADVNNEIVGHILLTKIKIKNSNNSFDSLALAPVSVSPKFQGMKIGKALIEKALNKAKEMGFGSVVVLGHENYYPKFGFEVASKFGIKAPFEVPDEVFMAIELKEGKLKNVSGVVEYSSAFID